MDGAIPNPSSSPVPLGGGGALPCIVVVIKCEDSVSVYHFTPGDDPSATLGGNSWPSGCSAMVCGGNDEFQSNCLADEAIDGLSDIGVPIDGVSKSGACGVLPDGGWYEG